MSDSRSPSSRGSHETYSYCKICKQSFRSEKDHKDYYLTFPFLDLIDGSSSSGISHSNPGERKEQKHRCEVCGKLFEVRKNLRRHHDDHHDEKKVFKCAKKE